MCKTDSSSAPWSFFHFILICLTAFSNHRFTFYGGQAAILEAIVLVVLLTPLLFVQLKLGGMVQKSLYGLFHNHFPLLRGVAVALVLQLFILLTYWPTLPVHFICGGFASVSDQRQQMMSCSNIWNTDRCHIPSSRTFESNISLSPDPNSYDSHHAFKRAPIDEYFRSHFYQYDGLTPDNLGGFPYFPTFPLVLAVTCIFVFLTVAFGPRVFAWVVSVLGVLSTIMMIGVLGYGWNVVTETVRRDKGIALAYYYFPDFRRMLNMREWMEAVQRMMWLVPVTIGILPTLGKFAGSGKVIRNISWFIVIIFTLVLRHLPALTISPYQYTAAKLDNLPMNEYMSRHISVENAMKAFLSSNSHPSASFFYFLAVYLHFICGIALTLLVLVDNSVEAIEWLLKKFGNRKRVSWFVITAIWSTVSFLLGLPYVTRGGLNMLFIVDTSLYRLAVVPVYCLAVGLIAIYIWQNIATAERIVIGIWTFFAFIFIMVEGIHRMVSFGRIYLMNEEYELSDEEQTRWSRISWLIASLPLIFIPIGIIVFIVQLVIQKMRSGHLPVEQPTVNEEGVLLKREAGDECHKENIEHISSF